MPEKYLLSLSMSSVLILLTACSVSTQDQGLGDAEDKSLSGVAIDGYIARAVVYADVNENNKLDVWEKRALTDSEGYFTYNPNTKTNYCLLPETDAKKVHCLNAPIGYDEVIIRMTRGYDLATVEPFTGTLSIRINVTSSVLEISAIGSPLNALLSEMSVEEKKNFFELETSIEENLVDKDYLDFSVGNDLEGANAERNEIIKLSINTHKVADVIASLLDKDFAASNGDSDGFFGVEKGLPVDASVYVYKAMVDEIIDRDESSSPIALSTILNDISKLESVVQRAFELMSEVVEKYNSQQSNVKDAYLIPGSISVNDIANNLMPFITLSNTVFQDNLDTTDLDGDVKARLRAVSIVASLIREKQTAAAQMAISATTDASSATNGNTYLQNLRSPKVDIALVKQKFIDGSFVIDDSIFDSRKGFTELLGNDDNNGIAGDNSEGFSGNTLSLGESQDTVGVAFQGETPDATSGTMTIDASFVDGDFEGENELQGTWEQLDEYTMLMNVEVAGVIEPVIIKPSLNEKGETVYNFDLGGEQKTWVPEKEDT